MSGTYVARPDSDVRLHRLLLMTLVEPSREMEAMASDDAPRKTPQARALTVLLGVTVVGGALAAAPALASSTSTTAIAAGVSQVVDVADPVTEAVTDPVTGLTLGTRTTYATTLTLQHENEIQPHPCP